MRSARPVADSSGRGTTALRARSGGAMAGHFLSRLRRKREPQVSTGDDVPLAVQPLGQSHATPPTAVSTVLHPWPRLSQSLTGPKEPGVCQSCGATNVQLVPSADPGGEIARLPPPIRARCTIGSGACSMPRRVACMSGRSATTRTNPSPSRSCCARRAALASSSRIPGSTMSCPSMSRSLARWGCACPAASVSGCAARTLT